MRLGSTIVLFLSVCTVGCSFGGRRVPGLAPPSSAASTTSADLVGQEGLVNAIAQLNTELAAIKAGRDTYTGLTFTGEMSVMLAILIAIVVLCQTWESTFDRFCEFKESTRSGLK